MSLMHAANGNACNLPFEFSQDTFAALTSRYSMSLMHSANGNARTLPLEFSQYFRCSQQWVMYVGLCGRKTVLDVM